MQKIFILIIVFNVLAYYLLISGLEFLALIILLLYVGAIAVLFLFVIMILNPDYQMVIEEKNQITKSLLLNKQNVTVSTFFKLGQSTLYFSPIYIGVLLGSVNCLQFGYIHDLYNFSFLSNTNNLYMVFNSLGINFLEKGDFVLSVWQNYFQPVIHQSLEVINISSLLYTKYGIGLLLVGLMLLNSMIGAILLTLRNQTSLK